MKNFTNSKKTGAVLIALFLFSTVASAQKSVYDVVPGSGPKKKKEQKSVYDVTKGKDRNENKVYYPAPKRKNLPPGQAKKVYGGSAKDYAPGQVKKRKGWYWDNDDKKWRKKHKHKHKRHHHQND